jgi:hypothetical protein
MANEIYTHYSGGSTLYAVIRDRLCRVWYRLGQVFEEWGTDDRGIEDYAVALTDKSGGLYAGDFGGSIPQGTYKVAIFHQAGSVPGISDQIVDSQQIYFGSGGAITAEKLMSGKAVQDKISGNITYYDDDGCTAILKLEPNENAGSISRIPV